MTHKHFKALAEALAGQRPGENWDANKRVQWNLDVKAIAGVCRCDNRRFDHDRFYTACGGLFNV